MISLPTKVKMIKKEGNKASFEIEALYPGYGVTIGNSLRRVLLSSLPGAAITEVRIKGVSHEFSTIPGVLEDVVSILMNLKTLRFRLFSEEPQVVILKVLGEKEVKGSDFKIPAQVELVNKSAHIATLTSKKDNLEMEAKIEKGLGYFPVERREREKLEPGVIAIDAIFTPIRRVAFRIENVRVGERTDFDKLFLEIETDGTISPEKAFKEASKILMVHFSSFSEKIEEEIKEEKEKEKEELKKMGVDELNISTRTANALKENGIKTLSGILARREETLSEMKGIGKESVKEIKKAVEKLGFTLKS